MYPPDRARAHRTAAPPEGDRRVHPVQVVSSQLPQSDLAQVGHQVVIREVAVQGYGPRLQRVLSCQPRLQVLPDGHADADVDHERANELLQRALGCTPGRIPGLARLQPRAITVAAVLERVSPAALAPMGRERAVLIAGTVSGVTLDHSSVLHRETPTRSSNGALGTRISLPSSRIGVGQFPAGSTRTQRFG